MGHTDLEGAARWTKGGGTPWVASWDNLTQLRVGSLRLMLLEVSLKDLNKRLDIPWWFTKFRYLDYMSVEEKKREKQTLNDVSGEIREEEWGKVFMNISMISVLNTRFPWNHREIGILDYRVHFPERGKISRNIERDGNLKNAHRAFNAVFGSMRS